MIKQKVFGYIVQENQLLVFDHDPKYVDAGIQVPGGTVDEGEDLIDALLREIAEESGLTDLKVIKKLDEYQIFRKTINKTHHRHIYLLEPTVTLPKTWTHVVKGSGNDEGLRFHYRWIPIPDSGEILAADLGQSLGKLSFTAPALYVYKDVVF